MPASLARFLNAMIDRDVKQFNRDQYFSSLWWNTLSPNDVQVYAENLISLGVTGEI